ncbi:MAG: transglycosylase domain-containing protein, partial [Anaerolineae bacterium]|nr:transglycosylase domain-containing protein [Anaerolineae bacterium]
MPRIRWWLLIALVTLVAGAILVYFGLLADLPDPRQPDGRLRAGPASILITDRHGRLLYEVIDPAGSKNVPLALDQVPLACRQATVATEDSRFYSHPGFDLVAIARAAWHNLRGDGAFSGASTLTQQVARNLFLSADERSERTLRRKVREAWLAWRLERKYSKDEILALYLNTTYYGHYAVGIEAAAQAYFGVHASELDLAQCALLAGLPQYPAGYNPIENLEAARARQATVLRLMAEQGYISAAEAQEAAAERLAFASTPFPIAAPHFVMWVQSQLEALLPPETVRRGGLRVVTTLDLDWQRAAEDAVSRRLAQLRPCAATPGAIPGVTCDPQADPLRRVENAALVALDPRTGAVLAMVGSPDYFNSAISGAVNGALSLRQPGSAIKPVTYAAALDPARAARDGRPVFTAATVIPDLRTVFLTAEGEPYVPNNYDRIYHGPVTVRAALANSYNIPAVATLNAIGVDALIEQANALGIGWRVEDGSWRVEDGERQAASSGIGRRTADIEPFTFDIQHSTFDRPHFASRYGLSLTLGGGEVRLLDLTAAYAAFANGGHRVIPYAIERIETLEGEAANGESANGASTNGESTSGGWQRTPSPIVHPTSYIPHSTFDIPHYALDPRVAFLITDIPSDNNARLPAFGPGTVLEIGRPAAVKTGTTTDWRDNWTVGYTPELVAGVWVGNADNTPMKDVSGISGAGPIWRDFMLSVLRDVPPSAFAVPDGLVQVEICADSGLLPGADTYYEVPSTQYVARNPAARDASSPQSAIRNPQRTLIPCPHRRLE